MNLKCGIAKDLIPLYIDGVCGEESRVELENHLEMCENCKKYYESMKEENNFYKTKNNNREEEKMKDSLRKVKIKINKKIRNIVICAVAATLVITGVFQILFNVPIKNVDKSEVTVSARVYPFSQLPHTLKKGENSLEVSMGKDDASDVYRVVIPSETDLQIGISEKAEKESEFATVITTSSDYFLRSVNWEIKNDTIYISSFKTTILGNKAREHQKTMSSLEFKEINKIVFTGDGKNTVLWEREQEKNEKN